MDEKESAPLTGPLVGLLLISLKKAIGPLYDKILEQTPWKRYLKRPPSNDPAVIESNGKELGQVCEHIYHMVGRDLFITFGRYAGTDGGKIFGAALKPLAEPTLVGLKGITRLQQAAVIHMQVFSTQSGNFSLSNTAEGVEVTSYNCGMCERIKSDEPVCYFIGDGLRSCYTILTGDQIAVKEVQCQAQGKVLDCVFKATISFGHH